MTRSYRDITPETARHIKMVMADVDGTLNTGGDHVSPAVADAICRLKESDIIVGLVSGRTDPRLRAMALNLELNGPLIAENGAVARLTCRSGHVDLGHSRQPALETLEKLKACFPGKIRERQDNADRMIDMVFWADGVKIEELQACARDAQILDSTYIFHLMQKDIDKGKTLQKLLEMMDGVKIRIDEVLVVGDSMTDLALLQRFPESVLVPNPNIPDADREMLRKAARYITDSEAGDGFTELALHIIHART